MKNLIKLFTLLLCSTLLLFLTSCTSKNDDITETEEQVTYLKATINGENYVGIIEDFNTDNETYFYIDSKEVGTDKLLQFHCNFAPSINTFQITSFNAPFWFYYVYTNSDIPYVYQTGLFQDNFGTGTITINEYLTDIYNTSLKGTFSFTAPCYGDCNGEATNIEVSNGEFFVKLN